MSDEHIKGLYPFLEGKKTDPHELNKALCSSVTKKSLDHLTVQKKFFEHHEQEIVNTAMTIADIYQNNGRLFVMGNGGSSCDASHIAVEFLHPITTGRPALTAIDLTSDRTMMTAIGNDIGFDHIFVRQLIAQAQEGDGVIGLSTSGNSANLIKAFEKAKQLGLKTIGLAGTDGGEMANIGLDHCLVVSTDSIHRIQECHVTIYHILWDLVHTILADHRGEFANQPDGIC